MEAKINLVGGFLLLILGVVAVVWSEIIAIPLGLIALWFAVALFINAYQLFRQDKEKKDEKPEADK